MTRARQSLPVIASCDGCGACCTGQSALPVSWWVGAIADFGGDRAKLPADLRAELEALRDRFLAEGFPPDGAACVWYDAETKRCRHYEYRPEICHDLAVGSDGCRRWRRALGIDPRTVYTLGPRGRVVKETR